MLFEINNSKSHSEATTFNIYTSCSPDHNVMPTSLPLAESADSMQEALKRLRLITLHAHIEPETGVQSLAQLRTQIQ
jgi:hypothetical protein